MFAFKTLGRRLIVLLVVPITVLLLVTRGVGYHFIHGILLKEWQEIAILRLERAAHQMDMKLHEQMEWMETFARAGQNPQGKEIQRWLLQQANAQPGVRQVYFTWNKENVSKSPPDAQYQSAELSPIGFFFPSDGKTVGLRAELLDGAGRPIR